MIRFDEDPEEAGDEERRSSGEPIDVDFHLDESESVPGDPLQEELKEFGQAAESDQVQRMADRVFEHLAERLDARLGDAGPQRPQVPTPQEIAATTGTLIVLGAPSATGVLVQAVNIETGAVRRAVISEQLVAGERQPAALLPQVRAGEYDVISHRHFVTVDIIAGEATIVDFRR